MKIMYVNPSSNNTIIFYGDHEIIVNESFEKCADLIDCMIGDDTEIYLDERVIGIEFADELSRRGIKFKTLKIQSTYLSSFLFNPPHIKHNDYISNNKIYNFMKEKGLTEQQILDALDWYFK